MFVNCLYDTKSPFTHIYWFRLSVQIGRHRNKSVYHQICHQVTSYKDFTLSQDAPSEVVTPPTPEGEDEPPPPVATRPDKTKSIVSAVQTRVTWIILIMHAYVQCCCFLHIMPLFLYTVTLFLHSTTLFMHSTTLFCTQLPYLCTQQPCLCTQRPCFCTQRPCFSTRSPSSRRSRPTARQSRRRKR